MNKVLYQLNINFKRIILRNPAFFLFDLAMPVAFYLLFTRAMPASSTNGWKLTYLVSMVIYGILIGSIMTVAHTLSSDINNRFTLFVKLSPLSRVAYYLEMIAVFEVLNILCTLGIGLSGYWINNLSISSRTWFTLILAIPILSFPLILLGIVISLLKDSDTINAATNLIVFPMAIASGLWWPLSLLPDWLQSIGKLMPTYYITEISSALIHQNSLPLDSIYGLIIWTIMLVLALSCMFKFHHDNI